MGACYAMKKILVLTMVALVLAFAGCAFAAGHGSTDTGYVPVTVTSGNVTVSSGAYTVESEASASASEASSASSVIAASLGDSETVNLVAGLKLDISHDAGVTADITISGVSGVSGSPAYAWISSKSDESKFTRYSASYADSKLVIKSVPLDNHFTTASIYFGNVASSGGGSGSGGGCNAGFAGLLLIAAAPFFLRKKK